MCVRIKKPPIIIACECLNGKRERRATKRSVAYRIEQQQKCRLAEATRLKYKSDIGSNTRTRRHTHTQTETHEHTQGHTHTHIHTCRRRQQSKFSADECTDIKLDEPHSAEEEAARTHILTHTHTLKHNTPTHTHTRSENI